jgi:hypothetical protein
LDDPEHRFIGRRWLIADTSATECWDMSPVLQHADKLLDHGDTRIPGVLINDILSGAHWWRR